MNIKKAAVGLLNDLPRRADSFEDLEYLTAAVESFAKALAEDEPEEPCTAEDCDECGGVRVVPVRWCKCEDEPEHTHRAPVAQMEERGGPNFQVDGSSPSGRSTSVDPVRVTPEMVARVFDKWCADHTVGDIQSTKSLRMMVAADVNARLDAARAAREG